MNIDVGSTVGDYEVVAVLGAGGMGKVFKVRNVISDRVEAMKVLLPDLSGEPDLADRFLREIKVLASLSHPNIAGLHTALRFENQLLMVMELVEGITLEERLHQGKLSVAEVGDYVGQVLSALSYAHQHGVVHRDIKPANMMLTASGVIKLMDFGIAKSAVDRKLTMTGTTMGSLYYMSPEQIKGAQTLDARSDLYSVGVSLYELVTGKRPFEGDSQFSIMSAHLEKTPVPPIELDPTLPPALNEIILLSVEREPERRFQTADAFRNALASVTASASVIPNPAPASYAAAPPPPAPPPGAAAPKSHRGLWIAAGALCAVAAVIAVIEFAPSKKAAAGAAPVTMPAASVPIAPVAPPTADPTPPVASQPAASSVPPPVETAKPEVAVKSAQPAKSPQQLRVPDSKPARSSMVAASPAQQGTPAVQAPAPAGAQAQAPPQQIPPAQSAPAPDRQAQIAEQKIRMSLVQLSARASAIHNTLQNLQRSQAASGLGLRRDWVESANLMDTFLRGSNDALNAGDVASAEDFLKKAEIQVDKLDKALR